MAVPGTIDERTINTKRVLNPWERNENHTLCLNSAKAIGCTVVNIGPHDLVEGRVSQVWLGGYFSETNKSTYSPFLAIKLCSLIAASPGSWINFSNHKGMRSLMF